MIDVSRLHVLAQGDCSHLANGPCTDGAQVTNGTANGRSILVFYFFPLFYLKFGHRLLCLSVLSVKCCIIMYCTLYSAILYYAILALLNASVLYCTVPYFQALFCAIPWISPSYCIFLKYRNIDLYHERADKIPITITHAPHI